MSRADELVELIRGRIHSEFDGECRLTDTEAHAIADFLSETAAALDEREISSGLTSNGNLWRFWAQKAKDMAVKLSEAERRARREALEEAAILAGSIGDEQIQSGSLDLDASVDKIIVAIRALIPSEPHDAEGRENPRRGDPYIFDDAEGRN